VSVENGVIVKFVELLCRLMGCTVVDLYYFKEQLVEGLCM